MTGHKFEFGKGTGGAALPIKVVARASRNEIVGVEADGSVKIRVTAPPVEGEANEAIIKLLSDVLGIPKSNIDIVAGLTSANKLVSLIGINPAQVDEKLRRAAKGEKPPKPKVRAKPKTRASGRKKK